MLNDFPCTNACVPVNIIRIEANIIVPENVEYPRKPPASKRINNEGHLKIFGFKYLHTLLHSCIPQQTKLTHPSITRNYESNSQHDTGDFTVNLGGRFVCRPFTVFVILNICQYVQRAL